MIELIRAKHHLHLLTNTYSKLIKYYSNVSCFALKIGKKWKVYTHVDVDGKCRSDDGRLAV